MSSTSRLETIFRHARWLAPAVALGLAALSVGLGQLAYTRVLAPPEHQITFIVEEGLPYGITQETVDAAAADRALSYEPFTVLVVERELTWAEYQHGEIPHDADVMLSVGYDPADVDLTLSDSRRASVSKLADQKDWRPQYRAATDIRETFFNNLTQGHGPGAVVGAALTAGSEAFDGGTRSPVFWGAFAALPLLIALFITLRWLRFLVQERARKRAFSRARLQLARVVLELDVLEAHFEIAGAELGRVTGRAKRKTAKEVEEALQNDWSAIRKDSLSLAQAEQLLAGELLGPRTTVYERGEPSEPMPLAEFTAATEALQRRADALAAASSLRVGHAGGGTVLGRIALPVTQAVEEILRHRGRIPLRDAKNLETRRNALLALVQESESAFGAESGPEVIIRHADLIERWRRAELRLAEALVKIEGVLRKRLRRGAHINNDEVNARDRERVRVTTGGQADTLDELRTSLGIAHSGTAAPSWHAERVLVLLEKLDSFGTDTLARPPRRLPSALWMALTSNPSEAVFITLPLIVALVSGWIAAATIEGQHTGYGRTLTGDQPLAALYVAGDTALIPDYAVPPRNTEKPANAETLTLEYVRDRMESSAQHTDTALLPERVELIVTILPLEEYVSAQPQEDRESRLIVDYFDMLDAYPRIKEEAAAVLPEAIDPITNDVRPGYAILPLWLSAEGTYGTGLPLTGELSSGVDSRLGSYWFVATELMMFNVPDDSYSLPVGDVVASRLSDLGRQMEYNNQRSADIKPSTLFWTVAIAAWTGAQTVVLAGWSLAEVLRSGAGTRHARRQLRGLRERLNRLALGMDLSRLDAVAVLGAADGQGGKAAEADQRLYETMLLTAWREVQELEELPRRMQRGAEWRARVERMSTVIDSLEERETDVSERALALIRG